MPEPKIRVLESFQAPRKTTNPYITMLFNALGQTCEVQAFTWKEALRGDFNVFHVHWPEVLLASARPTRRAARRVAFGLLLARIKSKRIAVVRTMHNLKPHETPSRIDAWLLNRLDRLTTAWIRLNPMTDPGGRDDVTTILLGHYLDWFDSVPDLAAEPNRIVNFGLIRPYKGVVELVGAFHSCADPELRLIVMGRPSTPELESEIRQSAAGDERITLSLEHVDDDDLAREVKRSTLVVLPHHNMHNSSSLLLALSLDRPALVPRTEVTEAVADEVGEGWVYLYDSEITPEAIESCVTASQSARRSPHPDLSGRSWDKVADAHVAVFKRALAKVRS